MNPIAIEASMPQDIAKGDAQESGEKLLLIESQESLIKPIISELADTYQILWCRNLAELGQVTHDYLPTILLIGSLHEASCFEVHHKCSQQFPKVPVIMVVDQLEVNSFFKDWAVCKGVSDVLSRAPEKLFLLRSRIQEISAILPQASLAKKRTDFDRVAIDLESQKTSAAHPPLAAWDSTIGQELPTYKEVEQALNLITENSLAYFGSMALGNYWKKSQSHFSSQNAWLNCWEIDYRGKISYQADEIPPFSITPEDYLSLQLWVGGFLKECERIIIGHTQTLYEKNLSPSVNQLILLCQQH